MPKIKFKMILPDPSEANTQPVVFRCKSCSEEMRLEEIDTHAKDKHKATSVMVDTTT